MWARLMPFLKFELKKFNFAPLKKSINLIFFQKLIVIKHCWEKLILISK